MHIYQLIKAQSRQAPASPFLTPELAASLSPFLDMRFSVPTQRAFGNFFPALMLWRDLPLSSFARLSTGPNEVSFTSAVCLQIRTHDSIMEA